MPLSLSFVFGFKWSLSLIELNVQSMLFCIDFAESLRVNLSFPERTVNFFAVFIDAVVPVVLFDDILVDVFDVIVHLYHEKIVRVLIQSPLLTYRELPYLGIRLLFITDLIKLSLFTLRQLTQRLFETLLFLGILLFFSRALTFFKLFRLGSA